MKVKFLLLAHLPLLLAFPASAADDVGKQHPLYEEIQFVLSEKIMTTYEDGSFQPDQPMTHGEAVKTRLSLSSGDQNPRAFLPLTRGQAAIFIAETENLNFHTAVPFRDVPPSIRSYEAVSLLAQSHITAGYPDGTFRPNETITRGEFAAFIARARRPAFRNAARPEGSFLKDMTKKYTYQSDGRTATVSFEYVPEVRGQPYGFVWAVRYMGATEYYLEHETDNGLFYSRPYFESQWLLHYPVEENKAFRGGYDGRSMLIYTDLDKPVHTPYKTFADAVEVTTHKGEKWYFAPGHSFIKSVDAEGNVLFELLWVE